ncbi:hypothetical protein L2U69_16500 [Zavarzinia compransoris]|uniref:alpha/beta hydrolase family esterase n=1 Tax=Zavarzinia marina TaxID=2911065 RepID=UPI001F460B61|nr:PHB depolymerase family esterase [Zavarzinia marina]MCF4167250.1 hypothetical protein [Zavarzinia marina]
MAKAIVTFLLIAFCLVTPAVADAFPEKGDTASAVERRLSTGDGARTYLVQPVGGGGRHPVVVLLHGGTQNAGRVWRQTSLPTLGRTAGFIVVAPDGLGGHWNDGRGSTIAADGPSSADDLRFIDAVIADVIARDGGDPKAVFMAGVSNGGFMTMHFVCAGRYPLRAAANLISDLPAIRRVTCAPRQATPWLSLNGTDDPIVPFAGQPAGIRRHGMPQPELLSADQTFEFFAAKAGCTAEAEIRRLPDRDPRDGSWIEERRRPCRGGGHSVQYVVHGAGHIPPGLRAGPIIARVVGGANQDADTGTLLWSFFKSQLR